MSYQQKSHHQQIYQNLTRANRQRQLELEKQRLLHLGLLEHYQNQIVRSDVDRRRLQFHNFVTEKLEEQRAIRGLEQEQFHHKYLSKIQKLKIQREKLCFSGNNHISHQIYQRNNHNNYNIQHNQQNQPINHVNHASSDAEATLRNQNGVQEYDHAIYYLDRQPKQHKVLNSTRENGLIRKHAYITNNSQIQKNQIFKPKNIQKEDLANYGSTRNSDDKLFYNSALADRLYQRWVPYDQRDTYYQKIKEKQYQDTQKHLQKIQSLHNQIRQRKIPKIAKQIGEQIDGIDANYLSSTGHFNVDSQQKKQQKQKQQKQYKQLKQEKQQQKQNTLNNNSGIIVNRKLKDNILIKEKDSSSYSSKKKNKKNRKKVNISENISLSKKRSDSEDSINTGKEGYMIPKVNNKNKTTSATNSTNPVLNNIKNRLELSFVVYADSQYRNIVHQKNHLNNKYSTQCKMRKDIIGRICTSKTVSQKYKNVGLIHANQD